MIPVHVAGAGLWTPADGEPDISIVPSRLARGSSLVTRAAIHAFSRAVASAKADPARVVTIFGSAYGEIQTAVDILDQIEKDGVPSPARFMLSVHNTATGLVSIATQAFGFSTALAAGRRTVSAAFLEALAWLDERGGCAAVVLADEPLPAPLDRLGKWAGLSVAFLLSVEPPPHGSLGTISNLRTGSDPFLTGSDNPVAPALVLFDAILAKRDATVRLDPEDGWSVDFTRAAP